MADSKVTITEDKIIFDLTIEEEFNHRYIRWEKLYKHRFLYGTPKVTNKEYHSLITKEDIGKAILDLYGVREVYINQFKGKLYIEVVSVFIMDNKYQITELVNLVYRHIRLYLPVGLEVEISFSNPLNNP